MNWNKLGFWSAVGGAILSAFVGGIGDQGYRGGYGQGHRRQCGG